MCLELFSSHKTSLDYQVGYKVTSFNWWYSFYTLSKGPQKGIQTSYLTNLFLISILGTAAKFLRLGRQPFYRFLHSTSLACHTLYQLLRERKGLVTLVHVFWHCTRYFWKSHSPIRCILSHDVTSGTPTRTGPAHILIPHA